MSVLPEQYITTRSCDTRHISAASENYTPLVVSSLLFITNATLLYSYNEYVYAALFAALTVSSVLVHYLNSKALHSVHDDNSLLLSLKLLDKLIIFAIFFYGGYTMWIKWWSVKVFTWTVLAKYAAAVACFVGCVGLYYGGYVFSMGCFHPEICMQNYWHAAMHVIGSAGHHIVLWI